MSKSGSHIGKPKYTKSQWKLCPICKIRTRKISSYKRVSRKTRQVHVHATCGWKKCRKQHWWLRWRETRLETLRYEEAERLEIEEQKRNKGSFLSEKQIHEALKSA